MKAKYRAIRSSDGCLVHDWSLEGMVNLPSPVQRSLQLIQQHPDVMELAVLPDVHYAGEFCVGTAVATKNRIFPAAVGADLGCGMAALAFDVEAGVLRQRDWGQSILRSMRSCVPPLKHGSKTAISSLPACLATELSDPRLENLKRRDGRLQLGTLGRGNHFVEFQEEPGGQLWMMIHSGSRGMGRAIYDFHLKRAMLDDVGDDAKLVSVAANSQLGIDYLHDASWAFVYAAENRRRIAELVTQMLAQQFGLKADWSSFFQSNHNHVVRHPDNDEILIHRKGAQSALAGEAGMVPGSMGSTSFHTVGLGNEQSLFSCSHGAGRVLSRKAAVESLNVRDFIKRMKGVVIDRAKANRLVDEAPAVYRDVRKVVKAQRPLLRTVRQLKPVINYKAV